MPLRFMRDVTQEELIQDILWYVSNGKCTIGHTLIHREGVRLIVENNPAPMADDQQIVEISLGFENEVNEEDDETNEEQTEEGSYDNDDESIISETDVHVISLTNIEQIQTTSSILARPGVFITNQMYEKRSIEQWLRKYPERGDPLTRLPVLLLDRVNDFNVAGDNPSDLHKLYKITKVYLAAVQDHIFSHNNEEVLCWLKAWSAARDQFSACEDVNDQENSSQIEELKNLNILLPNGKSILTNIVNSGNEELLNIIVNKYELKYTPSPYRKFIEFLKCVNMELSENQGLSALYENLGAKLSDENKAHFFSTPLLTKDSEDYNRSNKHHLELVPLQLACLEQSKNAVVALIAAGAQIRTFDEDDEICITDTHPAEISTHKKPEFFIAVDLDNVEIFKTLRSICMPRYFTYMLDYGVKYITKLDKHEFISVLINDFDMDLEFNVLLELAVLYNSEKIIAFSCGSISLDDNSRHAFYNLYYIIFNHFDLETKDDEIIKLNNILSMLLPLSAPDFERYTETNRFILFNLDAQKQLYDSFRMQRLVDRIFKKRLEYVAAGLAGSENDGLVELQKFRVYQMFYANSVKIKDISDARMNDELIRVVALGDSSRGDYSERHILGAIETIRNRALNISAAHSILAFQSAQRRSNAESPPPKRVRFNVSP